MPKMKTHSGAKKRFKVTGSGKITHEQANRRHLMEVKSSKRTRKLESDQVVAKADVPRVERMLGIDEGGGTAGLLRLGDDVQRHAHQAFELLIRSLGQQRFGPDVVVAGSVGVQQAPEECHEGNPLQLRRALPLALVRRGLHERHALWRSSVSDLKCAG